MPRAPSLAWQGQGAWKGEGQEGSSSECQSLPPRITWQAAGSAPTPGLARGCLPGALAEPLDEPWRCVGGPLLYPEAFGLSGPFLLEIISSRWGLLGKNKSFFQLLFSLDVCKFRCISRSYGCTSYAFCFLLFPSLHRC